MAIEGLHHITIGALDAQRTVDFYTTVLGLRFVKKTVNFDDPGTYHLYFGDDEGTTWLGDHLLRVAGRAERAPRHRRHASRRAQGGLARRPAEMEAPPHRSRAVA